MDNQFNFTPQQQIAFDNPCFRAQDTNAEMFRKVLRVGTDNRRAVSIVLTANAGYE